MQIRKSEHRNDLILKLSNELLKDGESELESLGKAGSVDKKKLLSASAKISARLNRCAEFQSEKDQVLEKLMKLSEVDS